MTTDEIPPTGPVQCHANRHVAPFLKIPRSTPRRIGGDGAEAGRVEEEEDGADDDFHQYNPHPHRSTIQVLHDGRQLTADRLWDSQCPLTLQRPIWVKDSPESIGMIVPTTTTGSRPSSVLTTVREVADVIGHHHPVSVIDVEHQEEKEGWSLGDLVDYFESDERLKKQEERRPRLPQGEEANPPHGVRLRRKAAEKCRHWTTDQQAPPVLNQISLEFSDTPLRDRVLSPRFVREMDWIDLAWPRQRNDPTDGHVKEEDYHPRVQYYCLTSAAGCYTDFHVDFGGTSVWYHVLSGEKDFCLIPPTQENLAVYEEWLCCPNQAEIFLPDIIPNPQKNVIRVSLKEGQTLVIPTAWIHGVYTPKDSLVLGGNFLHGVDIPLQLAVHCVECRARVHERFRFPHFIPIHFYAGGFYLDKLRRGAISTLEVDGLDALIHALEEWWKVHKHSASTERSSMGPPTVAKAAMEAAHHNHCTTVEEFLDELHTEHRRVRQGGIAPNPEALLQQQRRRDDSTQVVVVPVSSMEAPSSLGGKTPPPPPSKKLRLSLKMPFVPPASTTPPPKAVMGEDVSLSSSDGTGATRLRFSKTDEETVVAPEMEIHHTDQTMSHETEKGSPAKPPTKFRITLSSSKIMAMPLGVAKPKKRPREDTDEWIDEGVAPLDDEWMPSSNTKQHHRRSRSPKAKAAATTKPQTSRQRLLKRFR